MGPLALVASTLRPPRPPSSSIRLAARVPELALHTPVSAWTHRALVTESTAGQTRPHARAAAPPVARDSGLYPPPLTIRAEARCRWISRLGRERREYVRLAGQELLRH